MSTVETVTIALDPDWTVCRRWTCGHMQHSCCVEHLSVECPVCER